MVKFLIDEELAQAIMNYLASRPFNEVYKMVPALMQLQKVPEATPSPNEPAPITPSITVTPTNRQKVV